MSASLIEPGFVRVVRRKLINARGQTRHLKAPVFGCGPAKPLNFLEE